MTYSQRSTNSSNASDITYLEVQIKAAKEAIEQAKMAEDQELTDAAIRKLEELEAELDKLED